MSSDKYQRFLNGTPIVTASRPMRCALAGLSCVAVVLLNYKASERVTRGAALQSITWHCYIAPALVVLQYSRQWQKSWDYILKWHSDCVNPVHNPFIRKRIDENGPLTALEIYAMNLIKINYDMISQPRRTCVLLLSPQSLQRHSCMLMRHFELACWLGLENYLKNRDAIFMMITFWTRYPFAVRRLSISSRHLLSSECPNVLYKNYGEGIFTTLRNVSQQGDYTL